VAEGDDSEKTEEPTSKRMQDAVKKGQVAFSREVTNFLVLVVLALNIVWFAPIYMRQAVISLRRFIERAHDFRLDDGNIIAIFTETVADVAVIMMLPILAMVVVALASSFFQNGVVISAESIQPKLEKISVFKGIKRLFSVRSLVEFIKGILKISIVGFSAYVAVADDLSNLEDLVNSSIPDIVDLISELALKMVIGACAIMGVIAFLDLMYQKFEYIKSMKMSKQEIKDEYKQSEGDPHIKAKLRQIRMERAQNRMMQAVPDADVVIRNPTHFAIALKYDDKTMPAPMVLAMGQDHVALKIIEVAEESDVVVVTNKPLARALFDSSEIDQEIPLEHYKAVAEVIGYVYRLKGKSKAG
jgi:flagellar biosynthetic protein FlhB